MSCTKTPRIAVSGLVLAAISLAVPVNATGSRLVVIAQAMIPRTGMMDEQKPMPLLHRPGLTRAQQLANGCNVRVALSRS